MPKKRSIAVALDSEASLDNMNSYRSHVSSGDNHSIGALEIGEENDNLIANAHRVE